MRHSVPISYLYWCLMYDGVERFGLSVSKCHVGEIFVTCRTGSYHYRAQILVLQKQNTAGFRYNAIQYIIFHAALQYNWQIIYILYNSGFNLTDTSSHGRAMGCLVKSREKIDRAITTPHCISLVMFDEAGNGTNQLVPLSADELGPSMFGVSVFYWSHVTCTRANAKGTRSLVINIDATGLLH